MYKSNLFSDNNSIKPQASSRLWRVDRKQSVHADIFSLSDSKMVQDLVDSKEDNLHQLEQEVKDFEKAIAEATDDKAVTRVVRHYDIYELAQRMTSRLRVLLNANHQLMYGLDAQERESEDKVRQLEEEFVKW